MSSVLTGPTLPSFVVSDVDGDMTMPPPAGRVARMYCTIGVTA